jgi:hypothetical protein
MGKSTGCPSKSLQTSYAIRRDWKIFFREGPAQISDKTGWRINRIPTPNDIQIGKKGTGSSVNTEMTDDEPVFDKDITPQTIAIGCLDG